ALVARSGRCEPHAPPPSRPAPVPAAPYRPVDPGAAHPSRPAPRPAVTFSPVEPDAAQPYPADPRPAVTFRPVEPDAAQTSPAEPRRSATFGPVEPDAAQTSPAGPNIAEPRPGRAGPVSAAGTVPGGAAAPLAVGGAGLPVPLVTGGTAPYANLDHAASAPCLTAVRDAVDRVLPWYASVHRGAGFASQVSTGLYERCRDAVRRFVGARPADAVVFCRNTTDAMNLLAHALPRGTGVVVFESEHHASLLPWHRRAVRVVRLPVPDSPDGALAAADRALAGLPVGPRLLAVTGASNLTGGLWPVPERAEGAPPNRGPVRAGARPPAP